MCIYLSFPLPANIFPNDYSQIIKDENGEILRIFLNKNDQWCFPTDQNQIIPDKLKTAVIYYEDEYFRWHPGVNPVSVTRAAIQNVRSNRIVSGASTITMQTARISNPKSRSFYNKFKELFVAFAIELHYSKEDILKLYLNHAPYGGNIVGFQAACWRYFGKEGDRLQSLMWQPTPASYDLDAVKSKIKDKTWKIKEKKEKKKEPLIIKPEVIKIGVPKEKTKEDEIKEAIERMRE